MGYSEGGRDYSGHSDYLDTPKVLTDTSGNVVWNTVLSPYGDTTENTDPDGDSQDIAFNLRFPGQYHDRESGLYYNWNRTYDPESGRYIQADPIGLTGGLNTYLYGSASPTMAIDPDGLWAQVAVGVGIRVVGGRAAGAAVSRVFQNAFGRTAGRVLSCLSIGYCSESADEPAESEGEIEEGGQCPIPGATPGEKTKGRTKNYDKPGGFDQANDDFDNLQPEGVSEIVDSKGGIGRSGRLPNGSKINVRPNSSDGRPTVEIQTGKNKIKVRYY